MKSRPSARYNSGSSRIFGMVGAIDLASPARTRPARRLAFRVVPGDFFAPTETSGHAPLSRIGMCGQVAAQLFGFGSDFAQLKGTDMLRTISDGIANFRLCRLPESW